MSRAVQPQARQDGASHVALGDRGSPGGIGGSPGRLRFQAPGLRRYKWFGLFVILPTLLTALYYGAIATDRFVSEAQIVVRRGSEPASGGWLSTFLKTAGVSGGTDETSAVRAHMLSRDGLRSLGARLPVKSYFEVPQADFLARWPSWVYGRSEEEFYSYYRTMISVEPSPETGVLTISVQAFDPVAAKQICATLLDLAEEMINRLNDRMRTDAIQTASDEVARSEESLIASQVAMTQFRNRELLLDPQRNAVLLTELIGKLDTELSNTTAQIAQLRESAPYSPQLGPLMAQASSLRQQIASQRDQVATSNSGLAEKVAEYERLTLQQQFATRRLASTVAAMSAAHSEAKRQQVFLQRIVEPNQPDKATMPRRLWNMVTVLGWSLLFYLIFWLISSGLREQPGGHSA